MVHQNSNQSYSFNCHALEALKEKISSYPDLKIFINSILTALKNVMRSWHKTYGPVWSNHFIHIYIMIFQLLVHKEQFPKLAHDTVHGGTKLATFQNQVNTSKGKITEVYRERIHSA